MERVPMARMHIDENMREAALRTLDSGRWVKGPEHTTFGAELASYFGSIAAAPCANGSLALIAALRLLNVGPGDEVIVPAFTFIASATCIDQVGATPVFVDVESEHMTICVDSLAAAITESTAAIIAVHLFGQPVDSQIFQVAKRAGIPVIEDAAQAHGAMVGDLMVGSIGELATLSFFPSKNLTVGGDGGAILANRSDLADQVMKIIDHGRGHDHPPELLTSNFRLSEIQCALGSLSLTGLEQRVVRRNSIAQRLREACSGVAKIVAPSPRAGCRHGWNQFVIQTDDVAGLQSHLDANGIDSAVHYQIPLHLQPVYRNHPQSKQGELPISEKLAKSTLAIPVHPMLSDDEIIRIELALRSW